LPHAGEPHRHKRKLDRRKKSIHGHEREKSDEAQRKQ